MKVFPKRTHETSMRCVLEGADLEALLSQAAAKAAAVDLSAHNVKVDRVTVEGPDYSQHRHKPRAFVDLLVLHDSESLAAWVEGPDVPEVSPPKPPPMRCPALLKGYRPDRVFWTVVQLIIAACLIGWAAGCIGMK